MRQKHFLQSRVDSSSRSGVFSNSWTNSIFMIFVFEGSPSVLPGYLEI